MGALIEVNDTLKLKRGDGFPSDLQIGEDYPFRVAGRRLYNLNPTRVFLVEDIDGKWNYRGHALVMTQTIDTVLEDTRGTFRVLKIYDETYRCQVNQEEAPPGRACSDELDDES